MYVFNTDINKKAITHPGIV